MLSPEQLNRDLLAYLGITSHLVVTSPRRGKLQREIHLYVEDELISQVLSWVVRYRGEDVVKVFESPPPPF